MEENVNIQNIAARMHVDAIDVHEGVFTIRSKCGI